MAGVRWSWFAGMLLRLLAMQPNAHAVLELSQSNTETAAGRPAFPPAGGILATDLFHFPERPR